MLNIGTDSLRALKLPPRRVRFSPTEPFRLSPILWASSQKFFPSDSSPAQLSWYQLTGGLCLIWKVHIIPALCTLYFVLFCPSTGLFRSHCFFEHP